MSKTLEQIKKLLTETPEHAEKFLRGILVQNRVEIPELGIRVERNGGEWKVAVGEETEEVSTDLEQWARENIEDIMLCSGVVVFNTSGWKVERDLERHTWTFDHWRSTIYDIELPPVMDHEPMKRVEEAIKNSKQYCGQVFSSPELREGICCWYFPADEYGKVRDIVEISIGEAASVHIYLPVSILLAFIEDVRSWTAHQPNQA